MSHERVMDVSKCAKGCVYSSKAAKRTAAEIDENPRMRILTELGFD